MKRYTSEIPMHAQLIGFFYDLPSITTSDIIISASSFLFHRTEEIMPLINSGKIQLFSWLITKGGKRVSFLKVSKCLTHQKEMKRTV